MNKSDDYYVEISDPSDEIEIILPSDIINEKNKKLRKRAKTTGKFKWPLVIGFVLLIYLFYEPVLGIIMDVLKSNPTIYNKYLFMEGEIANNTILGLFFVAVFGSLFFLALPSEALFIFFLDSTQFPFFIIILAMVLGNVAGLSFNYFFGWILGERVASKIFSKSYDKYKEKIDNYGGIILILGNIFPGPIEVLAIFYGSFKFSFSRYIYLAFMGRLIKYLILFVLFTFYWDSITIFYGDILLEFSNLKNIYSSVYP